MERLVEPYVNKNKQLLIKEIITMNIIGYAQEQI